MQTETVAGVLVNIITIHFGMDVVGQEIILLVVVTLMDRIGIVLVLIIITTALLS
jgi:hypothetical protein